MKIPWARKKMTQTETQTETQTDPQIDVNALHDEIVNIKQKIRYIEKWMTSTNAEMEYTRKQNLINQLKM